MTVQSTNVRCRCGQQATAGTNECRVCAVTAGHRVPRVPRPVAVQAELSPYDRELAGAR